MSAPVYRFQNTVTRAFMAQHRLTEDGLYALTECPATDPEQLRQFAASCLQAITGLEMEMDYYRKRDSTAGTPQHGQFGTKNETDLRTAG